jgi:hypothetical protein
LSDSHGESQGGNPTAESPAFRLRRYF